MSLGRGLVEPYFGFGNGQRKKSGYWVKRVLTIANYLDLCALHQLELPDINESKSLVSEIEQNRFLLMQFIIMIQARQIFRNQKAILCDRFKHRNAKDRLTSAPISCDMTNDFNDTRGTDDRMSQCQIRLHTLLSWVHFMVKFWELNIV